MLSLLALPLPLMREFAVVILAELRASTAPWSFEGELGEQSLD